MYTESLPAGPVVPAACRDPPGDNGTLHPERRTRRSRAAMVTGKTGFFIPAGFVPYQIK
jgi:hypothetical protein